MDRGEDIAQVLAFTDARAGARELATLLTGLAPDLLDLVAGDQITDESVLGLIAPEPLRPVLRALARATGPIFPRPAQHQRSRADAREAAETRDPLIAILMPLLSGRANSINVGGIPESVRERLEHLVDERILDRRRNVYRASHVALHSSFRLTSAPPASTDIRMRQLTDIVRDFPLANE